MKPVIFVFGSNLAGIHGAGSALEAKRHWGAVQGKGVGRQGNSYAIPSKAEDVDTTLPLDVIAGHVNTFLAYAYDHPELEFKVVAIGCGLAGYEPAQVAPLFAAAKQLPNVQLPAEFR